MKRRAIEREYLTTLNETVDLATWKSIVQRAVDDAIAGDHRARDWISKSVLQPESRVLTTLAAKELHLTPREAADAEVTAKSEEIARDREYAKELDRLLQIGDCESKTELILAGDCITNAAQSAGISQDNGGRVFDALCAGHSPVPWVQSLAFPRICVQQRWRSGCVFSCDRT